MREIDFKFRQSIENLKHRDEERKQVQEDQREREEIKRRNHSENLKKEDREIQWKKLKVLLKEKMNEERIQFTR